VLCKDICKDCVGEFASTWSCARESQWNLGEILCPLVRKKIKTSEIPTTCPRSEKHKMAPIEESEAARWVRHIDGIRAAAWDAIRDRKVFFINHSFNDLELGEVHALRCRETNEPITKESCFFGHKINFFDIVDEFIRSYSWNIYEALSVVRNVQGNMFFSDDRVLALWLNFYKRKSEFGAQLLSKHGAYLRDQRWISNVQREGREGLFRVVCKSDGMPYRYLFGLEPLPSFEIKVVNKKLGGIGEYIGRPSPLGNPFQLEKEEDRLSVISRYREWILGQIMAKDEQVLSELSRLRQIAIEKGELRLQCWCAPKHCHGDVIKEIIENLPSLIGKFSV